MIRSHQPDEGAWIFVSHSHRDLREVRRVRDALESKGHQPLLFFLKCLNDDSEIDDLIRREIQARQFFLLCDSPNARDSNWVQQERRLIKDLAGKVSLTVDLAGPWQDQLGAIDELSRRATVYLSYSRRDSASLGLLGWIAEELRQRDYRIILDVEVLPGADLATDEPSHWMMRLLTATLFSSSALKQSNPHLSARRLSMPWRVQRRPADLPT